jgi:DNA polymerase I-like protein with 3'-5' exonuclease and polymerase domains
MTTNQKLKFEYVTTPQQYLDCLRVLGQSTCLAADTETYCLPEWEGKGGSALDPHTAKISLLILKGKKTIPYVLDILWLEEHQVDFEPLKQLLLNIEYTLWHNARYDLKFLQSTFGFMPENIRDTMIYSKMLGNATGSKAAQFTGHAYADLCREHLNVHISGKKDLRESTWYLPVSHRNLDNEWWAEKVTYAANDVKYLFPLENILRPAITNPLPNSPLLGSNNNEAEWGLGAERLLEIELQYVVVAAEIEYRGIGVSKPMLEAYQQEVSQRVKQLGAELCIDLGIEEPILDWTGELVPTPDTLKKLRSSSGLLEAVNRALKLKQIDNTQKATLTRLLDIIDRLFVDQSEDKEGNIVGKERLGEILINEDEQDLFSELEMFEMGRLKEISPIIAKIVDFKKYTKQEGMNLLKYINPVTGRIHYSLTTIGAATSRSSCQRPNLQQVTGRSTVEIEIKEEDAWHPTCVEVLL